MDSRADLMCQKLRSQDQQSHLLHTLVFLDSSNEHLEVKAICYKGGAELQEFSPEHCPGKWGMW